MKVASSLISGWRLVVLVILAVLVVLVKRRERRRRRIVVRHDAEEALFARARRLQEW